MATTLAQAKLNTQDDITFEVIDEFQKQDALLDSITFDDTVTPGTGGGALTYGWTYLTQERGAGARDYNSESSVGAAERDRKSVDLAPFSAAYEVDRVLGQLGPAASSEVTLQMQQAIKAVRAAVKDALVNGGGNSDSTFDGLDGYITDAGREADADWSSVSSESGAHDAIDELDDALSQLDGDPSVILTNRQGIQKLRAIARRAGYYARERDEFGRQVETYAGIPFMDAGQKAGSSESVIPVETGVAGIYIVRFGLDAFHGASMAGAPLVQSWMPDFGNAGAVKKGEVEMGPLAPVLKREKAAYRLNVTLQSAG